VSLAFVDVLQTVATLVQLATDLQERIEVLELKKWPLRK
jgi:hypothetical protein